jgi:uncharacterized protein YecE (DUF72 family)
MTLPLFNFEEDAPPQAKRLGPLLRSQAEQGVFWGTSSWKYDGWLGSIYSPKRYETRNKFSKKKFDETCLAEYAKTFPVVCGDFAFYQFPSPDYWKRLFEGTPEEFLFAFKVPEDITVPKWPTHARYGTRAGRVNEGFLNAKLFTTLFAERLKPYEGRVAALIFEFGTFAKATFPTAVDFFAMLDPFLASLPKGFRYSVEIRNPEYLGSDYFSLLSSHNTAHVFSAWTRMPELKDQLDMGDAFTADFTVARALLTKHRNYENAVKEFEPYRETQEPNPGARAALKELAVTSIARKKPAFLFVNNRLEGNAPSTIEAVVDG